MSLGGTRLRRKMAYRNRGQIGIPKGGNMDCAMVAAAPVLLWATLLERAGALTPAYAHMARTRRQQRFHSVTSPLQEERPPT
jgi:hypothetical protein